MKYIYLLSAILLEIAGANAMKASEQFTKLWPVVLMVACYLGSFYFLSVTLKYMPLSIAYAIWAGLGIVLTAVLAAILFKQVPDAPAVMGILLIVAGVVIISLFSRTSVH